MQNHSPTDQTNQYLLLFRGSDWHLGMSPEQIQSVMSDWSAWFERLSAEGKVKSGQPLHFSGKLVSGAGGRHVTDGPFAESKEAIGGYFLVCAETLEEAVAVAQQCPGLEYGCSIEVRPVANECPIGQRLNQPESAALELAGV